MWRGNVYLFYFYIFFGFGFDLFFFLLLEGVDFLLFEFSLKIRKFVSIFFFRVFILVGGRGFGSVGRLVGVWGLDWVRGGGLVSFIFTVRFCFFKDVFSSFWDRFLGSIGVLGVVVGLVICVTREMFLLFFDGVIFVGGLVGVIRLFL